jgi:hypothetical protein
VAISSTIGFINGFVILTAATPETVFAREVLPCPEPPFKGVIGQTYKGTGSIGGTRAADGDI